MFTIKSLIIVVLVLTTLAGAANVWQQVSTPSAAQQIRDFTIIPANNHWFLADRQHGFWKSTDQGNTWTQINNSGIPPCGWTIEYDSFHSQLIAGVFAGDTSSCPVSFWRSSNEGTTWTRIQGSFSSSGAPTFGGPLVDPNGLIDFGARDGTVDDCGSWYSTDGGATTYATNATNPPCQGSWSWLYNPITHDYWFGTEAGGVYRGTDGKNFTQVFSIAAGSPGNAEALNYDSNGNTIVGGHQPNGGATGLWRSSGSGGSYTWTQIIQTLGAPRTLFRDLNGVLYFGVSEQIPPDTTIFRSTDQGVSWSPWSAGIPLSSHGGNLEAWHFVYNSTDHKLYTNVQDGATNNGYVYVTVQAITGGTAGLQPPTNLQLNIR